MTLSRYRFVMYALAVSALAACGGHASADAVDPGASGAAPGPAYAAVARGRVDVEGGTLKLAMAADGVIARVPVHEGERVHRGQELAALDPTVARADDAIAQARLDQARAQEAVLRQRLQQARTRAQRLGAAAKAGAGDGQSADDARDALAQLQSELDSANAATRIAAAQREQAAYTLEQHTLKAPMNAQIARVAARPGMSVSARDGALFVLLPQQPRIVRAELNAAYLASVHPGMSAQVIDDGDSQHELGRARVLRLSPLFGASTQEDDPEVRANERTVECVLGFDRPSALRVGQRVLVRFLADAAAPVAAAPAH